MNRYEFKTYTNQDKLRLINAGYNGVSETMPQVIDSGPPRHFIVHVDFPTLARAEDVRSQCVSETTLLKFWDVPGAFGLLDATGEGWPSGDAGAIAFYPDGLNGPERCVCTFPNKWVMDNFADILLEALRDPKN